VEFARDGLKRGTLEVGMHLHAWNSPPRVALTSDDDLHQPYLIEYPEAVMREKIHHMTQRLADTFQRPMISHRAGRWAMDSRYAAMLCEEGYLVDSSVTPHVSWRPQRGDPAGGGGSDYTKAPELPYPIHREDPCRRGDLPLLEVPVTIQGASSPLAHWAQRRLRHHGMVWRLLNRLAPLDPQWLRHRRGNLPMMLKLCDQAMQRGRPCLVWMLHSSEFMPAGSPNFRSAADIENLFHDMEIFLTHASRHFKGSTLGEFGSLWHQAAFNS
jgi:hypothetical protein